MTKELEKQTAQIEAVNALHQVQAELKPVRRNAENPYFKSSYADLCAVWESCRASLSKHGFCISQTTGVEGDKFLLHTYLWHIGGGLFTGSYWINSKDMSDPQKVGSAVTYARRYALAALVGLVIESDDDDGNTASEGAAQGDGAKPDSQKQHVAGAVGEEIGSVKKIETEDKVNRTTKNKFSMHHIALDSGAIYDSMTLQHMLDADRARREGKQVKIKWKQNQYGLGVIDLKVQEDVDIEREQF